MVNERMGRQISIGAVYTALDRLETKGLVSSWLGEPTAERGGRAKRYFKIEAPGVRALDRFNETMDRLRTIQPSPIPTGA
jgi:DNA-binding PadR family transcriptional regulator